MTVTEEKNSPFLTGFSAYKSKEGEADLFRRFRLEAWKKLESIGLPEAKNDLRRHRELYQMQIYGLCRRLPGRLLSRRPELFGHRSGRVHCLHALCSRVPC